MVDIESRWSAANITAPGYNYTAITPSNTVDDPNGPFRAIYVGGAGDIVIVRLDNTPITFVGAIAGSVIPVIGRRINSTNTTATNLVAIR